jgi:hypothetical protein
VRQYELGAGRGARLDACLGLAQAQGKPPWWLREARGTRDDLLRLVAARFFLGEPARAQAAGIARQLSRYAETRWRRDRPWRTPPALYGGKIEHYLFRLLKITGEPISLRTIQRALRVPNDACSLGTPNRPSSLAEVMPNARGDEEADSNEAVGPNRVQDRATLG